MKVCKTLYPTVMAGTNFVLHSRVAEGGLVSCPEKLIMDADQLAMLQIFQGGIDLTENGQALDAIQEARPRTALSWHSSHAAQL